MGFITIEALIDSERRFAFEIESDGLYRINTLSKLPIESPDKILKIGIARDLVVVYTEDRDLRNGAISAPWEKDDRKINNIAVYDWQGNPLWNIGQIVGDIKRAFCGFCFLSHTAFQKETGHSPAPDAGILIQCATDCRGYIIDAANRKVLHIASGKY